MMAYQLKIAKRVTNVFDTYITKIINKGFSRNHFS